MTSYIQSGVNIDAGNKLVTNISKHVKATFTTGCLDSFGGFGGGYELPTGFKKPVLISGTDGVGTKLRLANKISNYNDIGQDLVAMCYNDVLCSGAMPLYFLDYYASSKLNLNIAEQVIKSIANACLMAKISLIGGETAEMPMVFQENEFDIAGFCTGIVEKELIIDGSTIMAGDSLIALPSSGVHANGFSLINKIINENNITDSKILNTLLTPTKIYTEVFDLINKTDIEILGIAHITGGGIIENLQRIVPVNVKFVIDENTWKWPKIFEWIQEIGNVSQNEMYKIFNCGVGMILSVPSSQVHSIIEHVPEAWVIGEVVTNRNTEEKVCFK